MQQVHAHMCMYTEVAALLGNPLLCLALKLEICLRRSQVATYSMIEDIESAAECGGSCSGPYAIYR